jgi:hypothetical protein
MTSTLTVDDVINGFKHPTIAPIHGEPNYETTHSVQKRLNANAASVHWYRGGGYHRHIGAIISPTRYAAISPVIFITPTNPGRTATIPADTPPEARAMLDQNYASNAKEFQAYNTLQRALTKKIIKTFDSLYLQGLEDNVVAFANVPAQQIMVFLFDTYGGITQNELVDNKKKIAEPFDPAQPIESFFRTIQNAVYYADDGHTPFGVNQIISKTYTVLLNSGGLLDACENWNTRPLVEKGWNNLKINFTRSHKTYRLTKNTAVGAG